MEEAAGGWHGGGQHRGGRGGARGPSTPPSRASPSLHAPPGHQDSAPAARSVLHASCHDIIWIYHQEVWPAEAVRSWPRCPRCLDPPQHHHWCSRSPPCSTRQPPPPSPPPPPPLPGLELSRPSYKMTKWLITHFRISGGFLSLLCFSPFWFWLWKEKKIIFSLDVYLCLNVSHILSVTHV